MRKILIILLIAYFLNWASGGGSLGGEIQANDRDQIFLKLARETAKVNTIKSDFIQENHSSILEKVAISKGRFYYRKEDQMRWEITDPRISGFAVNGDRAKRWRGDESRIERFSVQEVPFIKIFTDQVFAWAKADLNRLRQGYRFEVLTGNPVDLKLIPIHSQQIKFMDHLRIVFAADGSHVELIEVQGADGDLTRIRFFNTSLNDPLQDNLFE